MRGIPETLPGVKNLETLIEFLLDPKKVKAHLEDVKKAGADLRKQIELVGKAKEIPKMLSVASDREIASRQKLATASKKAEEIVEEATASIEKARSDLGDQVAAFKKMRDEGNRKLLTRENAVGGRERTAAQALQDAEKLMTEAKKLKSSYEVSQKKLDERVAKLSQAIR